MKSLNSLIGIFLFFLLLTSCGSDNDDPTPGSATFRVDFAQSGDYEKFINIVTISGGEFKYRGTNDNVPAIILGDDLNVPSFSVEASNVSELEISVLAGFSPVEDGPAAMSMKFTVYKNGVKLDEKTFDYTDATQDKSEELSYKAN